MIDHKYRHSISISISTSGARIRKIKRKMACHGHDRSTSPSTSPPPPPNVRNHHHYNISNTRASTRRPPSPPSPPQPRNLHRLTRPLDNPNRQKRSPAPPFHNLRRRMHDENANPLPKTSPSPSPSPSPKPPAATATPSTSSRKERQTTLPQSEPPCHHRAGSKSHLPRPSTLRTGRHGDGAETVEVSERVCCYGVWMGSWTDECMCVVCAREIVSAYPTNLILPTLIYHTVKNKHPTRRLQTNVFHPFKHTEGYIGRKLAIGHPALTSRARRRRCRFQNQRLRAARLLFEDNAIFSPAEHRSRRGLSRRAGAVPRLPARSHARGRIVAAPECRVSCADGADESPVPEGWANAGA